MGAPAKPIAQVSGTLDTNTVSFATPSTVREGDALIAVIAAPNGTITALDDPDDTTWEVLAAWAGTTANVVILRRIATDGEAATLDAVLDASPAHAVAALLVYRDTDAEAAIVGASFVNVAASTNFACPARTLAAYSDLYLGVVVVTSALVGVTPPAGTTERYEDDDGTFELEVFELLAEAPGTTGTKTATTGANQSGLAGSIALAAGPTLAAVDGMTFALDPPGTIGLPLEGV